MRYLLYCTNCLQSITEPGSENTPADYWEDGEVCPYCQAGTIGVPATTVERFRLHYARKLENEDLNSRIERFAEMMQKYPEKKEPKEILNVLKTVLAEHTFQIV